MTRPATALRSLIIATLLLGTPARAAEGDVDEVAALLAGTFDSREKADGNPKGCRAVRIVAVAVPKSRLAKGAPVLYVEQAFVETPNRPYRQRFYRVEETADGNVVWRVFEPKEPLAVSGKWRDPSDLALFGPGDVVERIGCAVRLRRTPGGWDGATEGKSCPSAISGARYSTSKVRLVPGRLESWDRGFDVDDVQVWGPRESPCAFERRSASPPAETAR